MAKSIVVREGTKTTDEYWRSFPPFLWILRDVLLNMPEKDGKTVSPTEYLKTDVLQDYDIDPENSEDSNSQDEEKKAETESMATAVRRALTTFFPTFECRTLPPPSTSRKVMANVSKNQKSLDDHFNKGVDELVAFLKANVQPKKVYDAACDGSTLAALVRVVVNAVNDPCSVPALDNTWNLVVESRCKAVQEKLLVEYSTTIRRHYEEASKGRPLDEIHVHALRSDFKAQHDEVSKVHQLNEVQAPNTEKETQRNDTSMRQPLHKVKAPGTNIKAQHGDASMGQPLNKQTLETDEKKAHHDDGQETHALYSEGCCDQASNKDSKNQIINVGQQSSLSISLMSIHKCIWDEIRKRLTTELGPLLSTQVTGKYTLKSVEEQLESQVVQYQWETDPHTNVQVRKVVGGALYSIVEENRKRSWQFCEKLFTDLYNPIRQHVESGEDGYTPENLEADIDNLLLEYDAKSVGPAKLHVRDKVKNVIKENQKLFKKHMKTYAELLERTQEKKEAQKMYKSLQEGLTSVLESKKALEVKFEEFAVQQKEAEAKRTLETEAKVRDLKEKIQNHKKKEKEMLEKEVQRKVEEVKRLTEEKNKRQAAEEKLQDMKEKVQRNKDEEAKRRADAEKEIEKLKQNLSSNKANERERKAEAEREIQRLMNIMKELQQTLQSKETENTRRMAEADEKISHLKESLKQKEEQITSEKATFESILKKKETEIEEQQSLVNNMEVEHQQMLQQMEDEKEEERRQKEVIREEAKETTKRLNNIIEDEKHKNNEIQRVWTEKWALKEQESKRLSWQISKLNDDIGEFEKKRWVRWFGIKVRK